MAKRPRTSEPRNAAADHDGLDLALSHNYPRWSLDPWDGDYSAGTSDDLGPGTAMFTAMFTVEGQGGAWTCNGQKRDGTSASGSFSWPADVLCPGC